jgi:serine/threonine protein kinase
VQEFCNGGSVKSLLSKGAFSQRGMKNTWATIMHAVKGISAGLQYLHGKRICHGDLNPSNILLTVRINAANQCRESRLHINAGNRCWVSMPCINVAYQRC